MVRTLHFHCPGPDFHPWLGKLDSATPAVQTKERKEEGNEKASFTTAPSPHEGHSSSLQVHQIHVWIMSHSLQEEGWRPGQGQLRADQRPLNGSAQGSEGKPGGNQGSGGKKRQRKVFRKRKLTKRVLEGL